MRVKNSKMNHDMECLKIENWRLSKQLEDSKALNDRQEKNFIEEIQKVSNSQILQMPENKSLEACLVLYNQIPSLFLVSVLFTWLHLNFRLFCLQLDIRNGYFSYL